MSLAGRAIAAAGGVCGAAGVGLSAYAAHAAGDTLGTAATFLLLHAPLFVALGLVRGPRGALFAGWVVMAGLVLFAGDLAVRSFAGGRLFPMAAPAGGMLMIAGWLAIAVAAFAGRTGADGTD